MLEKPTQIAGRPIQRIGLIANPDKTRSPDAALQATRLILASGRQVFMEKETSNICHRELSGEAPSWEIFESFEEFCEGVDLILVFGGDGTMLGACRDVALYNGPPVVGVNLGRLGFLTSIGFEDLEEALEEIWENRFLIDSRALLEAVVSDSTDPEEVFENEEESGFFALNEFVINREQASRVVEVEAYVNGQFLTRYYGDGLIVSSPTGSTAYSLSAGGPVVSPEAEVFVLSPICPHALSIRSVVVPLDAKIRIQAPSRSHNDTILTADGQNQLPVAEGQSVHIRRSQNQIHLVRFSALSFFQTLSQKMQWGGAFGSSDD